MPNLKNDQEYTIEARSFNIGNIASHNFYVLKNEKDQVLAELHGLATDRETGKVMSIGYNEDWHSLRAYHTIYSKPDQPPATGRFYYEKNNDADKKVVQDSHVVFRGSPQEALAKWSAAVGVIEHINQKDLNYPSLGFKIFDKTINSNSVYRSFGAVMDVPTPDFKNRIEPGLDNHILNKEEIEKFKYRPIQNNTSQKTMEYVPQHINNVADVSLEKTDGQSLAHSGMEGHLAFLKKFNEDRQKNQAENTLSQGRSV
jgi:hypothetical protein